MSLKDHYRTAGARKILGPKSTGPSKGARKATVTVDSNVSTVTVDIKSQAIKENAISAATPSLRREIQTLEHKLAEKEREVSSLQQQSDANRQMLDIYEQLVQLYQQLNETHAQQRGTTARVFAQLQQQIPHDGDHDVRAAELLRQLSAKRQELERLQPGIRPTVSDSVVVVVDAGDVEDDTTGNGDGDGDGASWEILSLYKHAKSEIDGLQEQLRVLTAENAKLSKQHDEHVLARLRAEQAHDEL